MTPKETLAEGITLEWSKEARMGTAFPGMLTYDIVKSWAEWVRRRDEELFGVGFQVCKEAGL